ncbi:YciI family protein [Agrilutibacter solisilvae]|uniref:YciI family protein n=1 Tax=Agrilutibacter solisilvae TaxID=2763317 RepID=A0A975AT38_9GAMM|nr:YciI family protein [Lysobacter solisilvae]QSX78893.1 YciI family protein [Lysobacter solisilvae]
MQFLMLVYTDPALLEALDEDEYATLMRGCLEHADELREQGVLLASQQLEAAATARSFRTRGGRTQVFDGPFAETKEMLAGFNILEADSLDDAVRIAQEFPWSRTGSIEVRPVRDIDGVRRQVGARMPAAANT